MQLVGRAGIGPGASERFEAFLADFLQGIENNEFTPDDFERIRQSLLNNLENTPGNLVETAQLLKTLAFGYDGDFNWMDKRTQGFKDLSYAEFLEISKQFLDKHNQRLAILVRGASSQDTPLQAS